MKAVGETQPSATAVWAIATLFVTIVSCCSLIGVSIMPLISGPSYKVFITLFTGLAVGSLVGSAIFSLIPQAFNLHIIHSDGHAYLWKALVIFFGIYLFYFSERMMRIYLARRNRTNKEASGIGEDGGDLALNPISAQDGKDNTSQNSHHQHHHHHHHAHTHLDPTEMIDKVTSPANTAKKEIAPVAWMIIIGDGLHNLIDGLSIGAAFSQSIYFGMSTSVAVICEEFPHELGDFAVLISSGMTVKQALGFNFLSACTCYIGMVFGILLGDMTQSASYIFALAGGMFLYIALVDMMGELSASLDVPNQPIKETVKLLFYQNIGIIVGITVIFSLAWIDV